MLAPTYEHRIVCDNCGSVVLANELSPEEFCRAGELTDPAMPIDSPDGRAVLDEGDLIGGEPGSSAELILTHVETCSRCSNPI